MVHFNPSTFTRPCYLKTLTRMKYPQCSASHAFSMKLHHPDFPTITGRRKVHAVIYVVFNDVVTWTKKITWITEQSGRNYSLGVDYSF